MTKPETTCFSHRHLDFASFNSRCRCWWAYLFQNVTSCAIVLVDGLFSEMETPKESSKKKTKKQLFKVFVSSWAANTWPGGGVVTTLGVVSMPFVTSQIYFSHFWGVHKQDRDTDYCTETD